MSTQTMQATTVEQDKGAIMTLLQGIYQAHHDKLGEHIAEAYTADAAVFSLAPPLLHRGIDRAGKQAWLDSWEGPVVIEPRDMEIHVEGDLAFAHGFLRMAGTKKGPEGTVSFWMRETVCLERRGGEWRIVHEHASVPFYMDGSLRPAFDLQP